VSESSDRVRQSLDARCIPLPSDIRKVLAEAELYRELLERAIRGLKCIGEFHYPDTGGVDPHTLDCSLAGRVSRVFCTGMTRATELCREFGQDPDFNEDDERRREDDDPDGT